MSTPPDAVRPDPKVIPFPRRPPLVEYPRPPMHAPRLLRDALALPCRAVRDGWTLPPDGPEAA